MPPAGIRRRRSKPVRLLQFTDPHVCGEEAARVRGVATLATFRASLAHARTPHWPVDAVLLTGDLVQDDSRGYLLLAAEFQRQRIPVHWLPGNHDLPDEMEALLARRPFLGVPVAHYDGWVLVMLDTTVPGATHGALSGDSLGFLDDALERFADSHALVCLHHPPVPLGSRWIDAIGLENGEELLACLGRHGNVRGLVWGHAHQAYEGMRDGIVLLGTPSTCFQFEPGRDDFAIDSRGPGYRWLHLYPDGRIDTRVVWLPEDVAA